MKTDGRRDIAANLEKQYPLSNKNRLLMVWPSLKFLVGYETHQYLVMLLGSVCLVFGYEPLAVWNLWPL